MNCLARRVAAQRCRSVGLVNSMASKYTLGRMTTRLSRLLPVWGTARPKGLQRLVLVVAVALPCNWLGVEMKRAGHYSCFPVDVRL